MATNENTEQKLKEFVTNLFSEDVKLRWNAAGNAKQIYDSLIETLVSIVKNDPEWGPRCAAAYSLGELKDIRAIEPLITALKDEHWQVRQSAVEALGEFKDKRAIDALIIAFSDPDRRVVQEIPDALGIIGEIALEPVIQLLQTDDPALHYWAVWTLRSLGGQRALEALDTVIQNGKEETYGSVNIREVAIKAKEWIQQRDRI